VRRPVTSIEALPVNSQSDRVFLLYGDSFRNPNVYYISGFVAPDHFLVLQDGGKLSIVVPDLEKSRAVKESRAEDVRSFDDLDYQEVVDRTGDHMRALAEVTGALLAEHPNGPIEVEPDFPVLLADLLRGNGFVLKPNSELLVAERRRKTPTEVEALAAAQTRAEKAVSDAIEMLRESEIAGDTLLFRGVPLTAERLRGELDAGFAGDGYGNEAMIVAPGPRSSDPHWMGSGLIRPHQPLILDIFPQSRQSRYHGDVTRTVVKGRAGDENRRMYEAVLAAQLAALEMIKPGVNGRDVHGGVQAIFAEHGFGDDGPHGARYIHGTGHGLGLEVHELPRISRVDVELLEGDVVTVEPGLYDPQIGGVRIEDVVVITADGNRNLNKLPKELVIP